MTDVRVDERREAAATGRPVGGGKSMAVAIAVAFAAILAIVVAAAMTGPAGAAPLPEPAAVHGSTGPAPIQFAQLAAPVSAETAGFVGGGRDALFTVRQHEASEGALRRGADWLVVGLLFLAMTALTSIAWRVLGRSVGVPATRPRSRR